MPIGAVVLNESNPRFIKDEAFSMLVKSLKDCPSLFQARPLLCSDRTGEYVILGGNMRYRAAVELGYEIVPVIVFSGLSEEDEREIIIKDNGSFGSWDMDELANSWSDLPLNEWGIDLPDDWLKEAEQLPEEEAFTGEPPADPVTVLGDLYELNEHRLHCADSTDSDAVEETINGNKIHIVYTDPPYGISIVSSDGGVGGGTTGKYRPILGDGSIDAAVDSYNLCASLGIETLIFWGGNYYASALPNSSCWIVWDKQGGKQVTFADCELAWSNINAPVRMFTHIWDGFRRDSERGQMRVHPTQKPVQLFIDIANYFELKNTVLDLFLGSGSTLIACQQTRRTCYGQELDPKYCDVIVNRWLSYMKTNNLPYTVKRNGVLLSQSDLNEFSEIKQTSNEIHTGNS